ncbi:hypothetical protein DFH27DRAFT_191734 [Peziza echinospora]|nr:hypothetical protein DFH27DRAFT_191734 [Peziza echinospora]
MSISPGLQPPVEPLRVQIELESRPGFYLHLNRKSDLIKLVKYPSSQASSPEIFFIEANDDGTCSFKTVSLPQLYLAVRGSGISPHHMTSRRGNLVANTRFWLRNIVPANNWQRELRMRGNIAASLESAFFPGYFVTEGLHIRSIFMTFPLNTSEAKYKKRKFVPASRHSFLALELADILGTAAGSLLLLGIFNHDHTAFDNL